MTIEWKDPNMRLHGKRHKGDSYYFRWHYGKQRMVHISCAYVDKPTENQKSAREAFTELRREVARQLRDAELRSAWMRRFEADKEGYKMLHTYVYAKMKAGVTVTQSTTCRDVISLRLPQRKCRRDAIHRVSCVPRVETSALRRLLRGNECPRVETSALRRLLQWNAVCANVVRLKETHYEYVSTAFSGQGDAQKGVSTIHFRVIMGDAQKGVSTSYVGSELGKISIETRYMASLLVVTFLSARRAIHVIHAKKQHIHL